MANASLSPLYRQLARVHRRLLLQSLVNTLIWFWVGAILLTAAWFLIQPLLLEQPPVWLRWVVAGGALGLATVVAAVVGALRAPSRLAAALSLDSEFGLKERVTTSLTLPPELEGTPAGQALLADVNQQIHGLDVGSRFPVKLSWSAALVPTGAAILALIALFYQPTRSQVNASTRNEAKESPANLADIDQKMKELNKKPREKPKIETLRTEDLERLEAELEKIANKPRDSKEDIRERVKEMTALEDEMKNMERELADKSRSLHEKMKQLDRMAQKDQQDGPAKDLQKALAEGKFDKAREELERISKRIKNNEMSAKEKDQLQKQLEKMQQKLERLAQQKDKEEQLRKKNLDPETLQRELAEMKKENQKLKELQDLSKELGKCKEALQKGDNQMAMDSLNKAGEKMKEMEGNDQDLDDLRDQLKRLRDANSSCCDGVGEQKQDEVQEQDMLEDLDDPGPGGVGAGKRPLGKDKPFKSFDSKVKAEFDAKGKKIFDGYAPGEGFRKKTGAEIAGEIKQASQEAPEAIEQQRVPKAAREMMKSYYEKMGQHADKELKSQPKK